MSEYVEIEFDCLPLRSVGRMDIPIDASPNYRARCERIKHALGNPRLAQYLLSLQRPVARFI